MSRMPYAPAPRVAPLARAALAFAFLVLVLAGCATQGRDRALHEAQYAWSAAIRWGDFDGALHLVDPAWREAHPLTDLERERYAQVQISSYRDVGGSVQGDTARRAIDVGVVNRHTLAERRLRHVEHWRWDPVAETWWVTNGLPDLWDEAAPHEDTQQ